MRGSAVTGKSWRGDPFGPKSDIDVFVESKQLTQGLPTSPNPKLDGMVGYRTIEQNFPEIKAWNARWTEIAGRDISVAGFKPGTLPNQPHVIFHDIP